MFGAWKLTDDVVQRAARGSRGDVARLAEALRPQVHLMIVARLSPTPAQFEVVGDLTQDVLVGLTTGISRLETRTVGGLKSFVAVIVARAVSKLLQKPARREGGGGLQSLDSTVATWSRAGPLWQFLTASGTFPPDAAERAEQVGRLITELGRLKPEHREVITHVFFDQLPMREVAESMNVSRPAASMLLIRAVQALRRSMTEPAWQ